MPEVSVLDALNGRIKKASEHSIFVDGKEIIRKNLIRNTFSGELALLRDECSRPGWDGYDAKPLGDEVLAEARAFIAELPQSVELPELVPEPSGAIQLEWRCGKQKILTISLSGRGGLVYAGFLSPREKMHGEMEFSNGIPDCILILLREHFSTVR